MDPFHRGKNRPALRMGHIDPPFSFRDDLAVGTRPVLRRFLETALALVAVQRLEVKPGLLIGPPCPWSERPCPASWWLRKGIVQCGPR